MLDAAHVAAVLQQYYLRTTDFEIDAALTLRMTESHFVPRGQHWSRVWPSSIALSRWLRQQDVLATDSLELGCGVGLVSLALAHRGVRAVATDRVAHALAFTARNAAQNQLVGLTTDHLDWAEPRGASRALLVGADILYEDSAPERLFALVETAGLLEPGGRLVISGPQRRRTLLEALRKRLVGEGYAHSERALIVNWEGGVELIDVHVLARP